MYDQYTFKMPYLCLVSRPIDIKSIDLAVNVILIVIKEPIGPVY